MNSNCSLCPKKRNSGVLSVDRGIQYKCSECSSAQWHEGCIDAIFLDEKARSINVKCAACSKQSCITPVPTVQKEAAAGLLSRLMGFVLSIVLWNTPANPGLFAKAFNRIPRFKGKVLQCVALGVITWSAFWMTLGVFLGMCTWAVMLGFLEFDHIPASEYCTSRVQEDWDKLKNSEAGVWSMESTIKRDILFRRWAAFHFVYVTTYVLVLITINTAKFLFRKMWLDIGQTNTSKLASSVAQKYTLSKTT